MKDSFARQGINIEAAYRPNGDIEYIYQVGRLLTRAGTVARLQELVPGLVVAADDEQPGVSDLVQLSIDEASIGLADVGSMTVPQVLDFLDEQLPDNPGPDGGVALVDCRLHRPHHEVLPSWGTGSAEWLSDRPVAAAEASRRGCWREDWALRRWPAAGRKRYLRMDGERRPRGPSGYRDTRSDPAHWRAGNPEVRRLTGPSARA